MAKVQNTYYFEIDKEGRLEAHVPNARNEGGARVHEAISRTLQTIRKFGWSEGIQRTIFELTRWINTRDYNGEIRRIQLAGGGTSAPCPTCGHNPAAELAKIDQLIGSLRSALTDPPDFSKVEE